MNKKCKTLIFGILFVSCTLLASEQNERANSDFKPFVGTWALISWVVSDETGQLNHPYGKTPKGQIIYTVNGRMSAQLMHPGAVLPDVSELRGDEVIGKVASTFLAYYGTYSVDSVTQTITHHVEGSLLSSIIGTGQVRHYQFLEKDRLELSAITEGPQIRNMGTNGSNVLIWERIQ